MLNWSKKQRYADNYTTLIGRLGASDIPPLTPRTDGSHATKTNNAKQTRKKNYYSKKCKS